MDKIEKIEKIEKLKKLKDEGGLTEQEFEAEKKKLLEENMGKK